MQSRMIFFKNTNEVNKLHSTYKKNRCYTSRSHKFFSKDEIHNYKYNKFLRHQIVPDSNKMIKANLAGFPYENEILNNSKCLISISIGQQAHYGPYLAATLDRVDENFSSCVFLLGDTLQRNTLPLQFVRKFDSEFFYKKTLKLGDEWIEKNACILALLKIPYSIVRWDYWLNHTKFKLLLEETENLYRYDMCFKEVVEKSIEDYIDRLKNRNELLLPEDTAKQFCLKYVLEECSALRLWTELHCNYDLYPNKRSQAMEYIYEKFIKSDSSNLLKHIPIKFKRKKILEGLYFSDDTNFREEAVLQLNN